MAVKRMFSSSVTETDNFLELPLKSQALYFHLGMQGDDDGFVANPRAIIRSIGCTARDLKPLEAAGSFGAADYSPQVAKACTHLCMFPSLLGKVFRSELRKPLHLPATWYTFVPFAHLWAKKHCQKWQRRSMLRSFSENPKNSRRTFLISVPTSGYA